MGAPKVDPWKDLVHKVCERVRYLTGNTYGERQLPMVEARLRRHLLETGILPTEYLSFWDQNREQEDQALIALLTTHFTSFFREYLHFEWLAENLPGLVKEIRSQGRTDLRIWSAACSRGQEVWSLAMWLHYHLPSIAPDFTWSVHGTDIDKQSVEVARNGVYHRRELETAPRHLWQSHWQPGKDDIKDWFRAKRVLRDRCTFDSDNLLSLTQKGSFDVIFCRNVLIYFEQENQLKAVKSLLQRLSPHGVLITGVSESLAGLNLSLKTLAPSVYSTRATSSREVVRSRSVSQTPKPMKVLCVDDSPTVLRILSRLLDGQEFKVIGVASNGQEALEKIQELKPDVVTLDLHMPVMDGFTLISSTDIARRLPVVVVSTVERQNASLVHPLFNAGVCDFLEKPTLENMEKVGDELRQKLKMSWLAKQRPNELQTLPRVSSLNRRKPARIILSGSVSSRDSLEAFLRAGQWGEDELRIHLAGESYIWESWALGLKARYPQWSISFGQEMSWRRDSRPTICFGFQGSDPGILRYAASQFAQVVLEEGEWSAEIQTLSQDIFPVTSFAYMAEKLLEGK